MKRAAILIVRAGLATIYALVKLVTRQRPHKIVLLGRRNDALPLDFTMLIDELRRREPGVEVVARSMMVKGGLRDALRFVPLLISSLYHLATAKVCVLDSYWPAVSMLRHREGLVVYQLWHSLGKIKQSGHQALGRAQGRDEQIARAMRMHSGYDWVIAGAEIWNPQYCASFGIRPDQILNFGLPRADYLVNNRDEIANRIHERYPELQDKPVVLYVPTFRRGRDAEGAVLLAAALDHDRFTLVIKKHPSDTLQTPQNPHLTCPEFSGTDMLTVADFVITDYSSIALEAALIDAKTFYFLYDYDQYFESNGINTDLEVEMPGCVFRDAHHLHDALQKEYPMDALRRYKAKFALADPGHSTSDLTDHILTVGGLCTH